MPAQYVTQCLCCLSGSAQISEDITNPINQPSTNLDCHGPSQPAACEQRGDEADRQMKTWTEKSKTL